MTTKIAPATPLKTPQANDAEVKRRAAAYPRLVEALNGALRDIAMMNDDSDKHNATAQRIAKEMEKGYALLRELGEL